MAAPAKPHRPGAAPKPAMGPATHSRAKDVFVHAIELPHEERRGFLDEACGQDEELRGEVESLLSHHEPVSILEGVAPARRGESSAGRSARGHRGRRYWVLLAAALLGALGFWTHTRIEESLLEIRGDELETVLDAEVNALELWIRDQKGQLEVVAADPRVIEATEGLIALSQAGEAEGVADALRQAPARAGLAPIMAAVQEKTHNTAGYVIVDEQGLFLFASRVDDSGLVLTETGRRYAAQALAGRSLFVRPHRIEDLVGLSEIGTMYSLVLTPIRDTTGIPIAAIIAGQKAYGAFSVSQIFEVAQLGDTGETYAFDETGLMLTESRFTEELREKGLAPAGDGGSSAWNTNAQLNVEVRHPAPEGRPLTRLAAQATAAARRLERNEHRGVLLEPYENYRGASVLGAWQWLPEHEFVVATEIGASEALAPLRYLDLIFGVSFSLLVVFVATTLHSTFSVARLRRRIAELKELGPYRVLSVLGEGGMGTVYLAEHGLLQRKTAVKVLAGDVSEESASRFEQEVRLASALTHPNTIEIYDFGRTPDGVFYYAMEYVEGPTLSSLVARYGPLSPARAIFLLQQICGSLGEAHRRGLVHRDVKPQNLMLCERGGQRDVVKVLDFGLVRDMTQEGMSEGRPAGTPLYMAPERITHPGRADARVDVYALGAVGFYLLTGRPIHDAGSDLEILEQVVNGAPRPPSSLASQPIPAELDALVLDCIARDPEERPQTVFAVLERLEGPSLGDTWTQDEAARWWARHDETPPRTA